ncbi:MAG: xanthine dehydrogenase family protein molybdopterin-binding subunit [Bacilli bacterium]
MFDPNKSSRKVDHDEKCSGTAQYVSDIHMDGMHYARTLRSSKAHAKIKSIHLPKLPSDYAVVDHHDILAENYVRMIFTDWPVFTRDTVNYIGEPILLVVGPDPREVNRLLSLIEIEYEELPPQFELVESRIQKHFQKGDLDRAFQTADRLIEETFETGYQEQAYIEPQGMLAYPEGPKKITLVGSIQCPYYVKNAVLTCLGYESDQVRVIQPAVGGAFGGKEEFPSTIACQLATAVAKLQVPIKMIFEREEDMLVTTKRHPSIVKMKAGIDASGRVLGIKAHVSLDAGAYLGLSGVVLARAMIAVTGAYTIPNLDVSGDVYVTNTVPTGAFRGFGAPQMMFSIEMFMSHLARHLGQNESVFRERHLAQQGDLTSTSGQFRDPIIMDAMIKKAKEMSDYDRKRKSFDEQEWRGIGMSWFLHGCGFTGSGESTHIKAKVRLQKDTSDLVHVRVAAVDMGQGAKTSLGHVVAKTLGLPDSRVIFEMPDTDFAPDSGPTVASRTMMIVGGLLARAALKLKGQWVDGQAQEVFENYVPPAYIQWDEDAMRGDAYPAYSWGVNIVEVSVSPITYQVKIEGIWSVYDVGKAIDERIITGQADGGITQGVAYGYLEVMRHEKGRLKQKNLTDYIIPTSMDVPPMETVIFENPFAYGPDGAKGAGELTLVGGAPAVALAIEQAINHPINRIPATAEHIMELKKHD